MQCFDNRMFKPDQVITVAQIAELVGRVFGSLTKEEVSRSDMALFMHHGSLALSSPAPVAVTAPAFRDIPTPGLHESVEESIAYAAEREWFLGYSDGTFRPDRMISSGQAAAVVGRAFAGGVSRAEMASFVRRGAQALVAGNAVSAWVELEEVYAEAQTAWERGCADLAAGLMRPEGFDPMSDGAAALLAQAAAEKAIREAFRADANFWAISFFDQLWDEGKETAARRAAWTAVQYWEDALRHTRGAYMLLTGDIPVAWALDGAGVASGDIWWVEESKKLNKQNTEERAIQVRLRVSRSEEDGREAWDETAAAAKAAEIAERRDGESVREAWSAVVDKMDAAVWASYYWVAPSILELPLWDCEQRISAWGVWKEWAAAMRAANNGHFDVLAALD